MTNIQISTQATTAYIHKQVSKDFTNHSKLLVQFNNVSKDTPDYIYFTMHGTATADPVQAYLIVYGVKDWSDSVDPRVYVGTDNEMFEYKNNQMKMNVDMNVNMNNNSISGIRETDVYRNQNGKMVMKTDFDMNSFHVTGLRNVHIGNVEIYEGFVKQRNVFAPSRRIKFHDMISVPSLAMSNKTYNLSIISQMQFSSPHIFTFNIGGKPQQYTVNFNDLIMPSIRIMRIWYSSGGTPGTRS